MKVLVFSYKANKVKIDKQVLTLKDKLCPIRLKKESIRKLTEKK